MCYDVIILEIKTLILHLILYNLYFYYLNNYG